MSKSDKAESIRHQLRNALRERGEDMQFGLQRYAIERFLYRLGVSAHRDRFILKGAALFALWGGAIYRPTRDLDFTGYGSPEEEDVLAALRDICRVPDPGDEIVFDPATLSGEPIRDDSEYHGLRIRLGATLGGSRIPIQIDIGFGNAIEPAPQDAKYPTLLGDPPPRIRTYPPESVVAEKLHAMVVLGERNSRYKDFYDLHVLARQFRFDGRTLARAITATFERRSTPIEAGLPAALTPRFYADGVRAAQWRAYRARNNLPGAPADFDSVGELIRVFLGPVWTALAENAAFASNWPPGGPWNSENSEKEISIAMPASSGLSSHGQQRSPNSDTARIEDIQVPTAIPLRRFNPYPAYKESGVDWLGEIPAGWNLKRLKRVVEFQGGGTPAKENIEYWQGTIPWVSPKDMKVSVVVDTEDKITPEAIRESATKLVPAGAVLIVVRSGILVHSIPVALAGRDMTLNQDLKAMIPDSELVPQYLMYLISGMQRELLVEWKKEGATVESLELELVADTLTPLPSTAEQRAIATFLDRETAKIDALVAKKERLIELLQEKRAALITRAVTKGLDPNAPMKDSGVEWLGEIPAHWDVGSLKREARRIQTGSTPPTAEFHYYEDGTVAWYGPGSFTTNLPLDAPVKLISADAVRDGVARLFEAGSSVIVTIGATIGKVAYMETAASFNQQITGVSFDTAKVFPRYGAYQLKRLEPVLRGIAPNTTLPILDQEEIGYLPFILPPKSEQEAIVALLEHQTARIDALIAKVQEAIGHLNKLRTALISAAVTGKIDVREEAA